MAKATHLHDPSADPQKYVWVSDTPGAVLNILHRMNPTLADFQWCTDGGETVMCRRKAAPAMLMGMGWEGLQGRDGRRQFFIDAIQMRDTVKRNDPHFMAAQFFKSQKLDPVAMVLMLGSFGPMQADPLTELDLPIAVICGADDRDNGSAPLLAENLANAEYCEIPGTHMSSVAQAELADAMISFLGQDDE